MTKTATQMKKGDEVVSRSGMRGTVERVTERQGMSPPTVQVRWENGSVGTTSRANVTKAQV